MNTNLKKQAVPFTQVPNGLLYDSAISFKAKGIWAYMSAKPEGWNFSANRIAEETKEERKAILAGLKELSEAGYITAKKLHDGRIEYMLHWEIANIHRDKDQIPTSQENGTIEPIISKPSSRPKRDEYSSDEEFEQAFYKWNSK